MTGDVGISGVCEQKLVVMMEGDEKAPRKQTYTLNGKHTYVAPGDTFEGEVTIIAGAPEPLFESVSEPHVTYALASADRLSHIEDATIDYVFTDPPFGSNIFYSDMSLFHEAWLGEITNNTSEAVVHTTGKRKKGSADRYRALLEGAFSEAFRILKPGRYMSVVFGNSSGQIWGLVQRSLRDAGFKAAPVHVAILDKGQRSVKGLNSGSEGVVTVDLILTVQKPAETESADDARPLSGGAFASTAGCRLLARFGPSGHVVCTSALPPKADILAAVTDFRV